jgi:hypothetical protein
MATTSTCPQTNSDAERKAQQHQLTLLSRRGTQRLLPAGHDMHLEAPADVVKAILDVVREVRSK